MHTNVSLFDHNMPHSHITDRPMAPRGRVKERKQRHGTPNTTKVKQSALSSPTRKLQN